MSLTKKIQLKATSILNVPLQLYEEDFSFVVNGEEFKTSRIISDLLSPKICQLRMNDPTLNMYVINTSEQGNFSNVLKLVNFDQNDIPENEIPFILEVMEILNNKSIEFQDQENSVKITTDNVFSLILRHEKYPHFYSKSLQNEIEFVSSNFNEICDEKTEDLTKIKFDTLFSIINNSKLKLESEDQLLKFINKLYCRDVKYSILYETVYFVNVSSEAMGEFISHFDMNDLTASVWNRLSDRLLEDVKNEAKVCAKERYKLSGKIFMMNNDKEFNGIFNYLRKLSNNNIENEVTFDSTYKVPNVKNVVIYEDENKFFNSNSKPGNWISFDFKARKVILTDYTIRSIHYDANWSHPKS